MLIQNIIIFFLIYHVDILFNLIFLGPLPLTMKRSPFYVLLSLWSIYHPDCLSWFSTVITSPLLLFLFIFLIFSNFTSPHHAITHLTRFHYKYYEFIYLFLIKNFRLNLSVISFWASVHQCLYYCYVNKTDLLTDLRASYLSHLLG